MIKTNLLCLSLFLVAALLLIPLADSFAQEEEEAPSVEVDFGVLGGGGPEVVTPHLTTRPAMRTGNRSLTGVELKAPPTAVKPTPIYDDPANINNQKAANDAVEVYLPSLEEEQRAQSTIQTAPIPPHKPAQISHDLLAELSGIDPPSPMLDGPEELMRAPAVIDEPPVPPKRPRVVNASQDFIDEARLKAYGRGSQPNTSLQEQQENGLIIVDPYAAPGQTNRTVQKPQPEISGGNLVTPTASDVLASIEKDVREVEIIKAEEPVATTPDPSTSQPAPQPEAKRNERISEVDEENMISLGYLPGKSELPDDIKSSLRDRAVSKAADLANARIEIIAYATASDEDTLEARRLSLARALEIRGLLIDNSIEPTRIDIRPLGDTAESPPYDRVDIQFVE